MRARCSCRSSTLGAATTRSQHVAAFDVATPAEPRQLPSIRVGAHNGHRDLALTGDGRFLIVPDNIDNTVSVIDTLTRAVLRTIPVVATPTRLATFGEATGPSKPAGPLAGLR